MTTDLVRPESSGDYDAVGESRWPMVIAVLAVMALGLVPPTRISVVWSNGHSGAAEIRAS